jgi:hypothetical protein
MKTTQAHVFSLTLKQTEEQLQISIDLIQTFQSTIKTAREMAASGNFWNELAG